jgi:spore maturation protein CgeB
MRLGGFCNKMNEAKEIRKALMLVSAIDLQEPLGGTLVWWQLFKSLSDLGLDLVIIPYIGRCVETPWWHCYPNPTRSTSEAAYSFVKQMTKRPRRQKAVSFAQHLKVDKTLGRFIENKWCKEIDKLIQKERNIDVIIMFSLPIRPFERFSQHVKSKWSVPLVYFEADMPEVLPEYDTFGYSYYQGADLSVFDGYISNSDGVAAIVSQMGARNISAIHYAVDPDIYKPFPAEKNIDVLFSGVSARGREKWMDKMIFSPARKNLLRVAVSGQWGPNVPDGVERLGYLPFNRWLHALCSSKLNLNISRFAHANVCKTSTYRIFELCGMGCAVLSNPHKGIEEWYIPNKEIYVLSDDENPLEVYLSLLSEEDGLRRMGELARERTLREHTYRHRALSFLQYLKSLI